MCGICGFIGPGNIDDLKWMTQAMIHRGPDADGYWSDVDKGIYLGHRRLSIIDLESGAQPMATENGQLVVTFNGEIYNHVELRQELEKLGYVFESDHSDTEVLLHGFREWGNALPNKLNGMWAFGIYDVAARRLFLSRDRFGKKPLYYTFQKGIFAFASELNSLTRHSLLSVGISKRSLKKYFAYGFIPAPSSIYSEVFKLPGGHNLVFNVPDGIAFVKKYWDFVIEPFDTVPVNPEEEWGEQIRELLEKAVKRRLLADVPLGIFLSGGIDSSSITACAVKVLGEEKVKSFSIGFREKSFDESRFAEVVASIFKTQHYSKIFSIEEAREVLAEIALKLDEPLGDSSLPPTFLLCREARKQVTVALGGDGGDELFCGYDPFRALRIAEIYKKLVPKPVHQGIRVLAGLLPVSHRNISLDFKIKRTLRGLSYPKKLWNTVWLGPVEPNELDELFQERTEIEDVYSEAIAYWDHCPNNNIVDKTLQFYTKLYLQDDILVKVDRASMMNSLEVRAPFLDIDLVDFVRKIPNEYKFRAGETKYILKKALEPILPKKILYRSKKGFGLPVGKWFKEDSLNYRMTPLVECLNQRFLQKIGKEHQQGRVDHKLVLWNLFMLASQKSIAGLRF